MKKILSAIMVASFVILFNACYYDKADLIYPTAGINGTGITCDTAGTVSYSQKVVPILQNACYGCHSASSAGGGIIMGTYAADKAIAMNGKLYGAINFSSGYSPMPKGAARFTSCQVAIIKKWIDSGISNN